MSSHHAPRSRMQNISRVLIPARARARRPSVPPALGGVARASSVQTQRWRFIALAAALVLSLVCTLCGASPLGQTWQGASGVLQTLAGSVGIAAPPTTALLPIPTPTFAVHDHLVNGTHIGPGYPQEQPQRAVIIALINLIFCGAAHTDCHAGLQAQQIALCESDMTVNAINKQIVWDSNASGVFQILWPNTWERETSYGDQSPFDYRYNIRGAYQIYHQDGDSWHEWACQPKS